MSHKDKQEQHDSHVNDWLRREEMFDLERSEENRKAWSEWAKRMRYVNSTPSEEWFVSCLYAAPF